ncbi:AKT-interacting protein-like [Brevipalpus obovatus]|uniref:AKT-interacting protein-like n=1 Tax=Brevipalpus obovatus TaxID=246614 RepID=UPI003D9ED83C
MMSDNSSKVLDQCSQIFFEHRLVKEFVMLQKQAINHVYIVPSYQSPLKWFGVIFVHEGVYREAILRFTLLIPECSSTMPELFFHPIPFHPLVDPITGKLNLTIAFPDWTANVNHLWQIILYTKNIFHDFEREIELINHNKRSGSFLNDCIALFQNEPQIFASKVRQSVIQLAAQVYDLPQDSNDPNAIIFSELDPRTLEECRREMLTFCPSFESPENGQNRSPSSGLSWVQDGALFSKTIS